MGPYLFVLIVPAVYLSAWLTGLVCDFGRRVELDYYGIVATIIPVLLLAFMVEASAVFGRIRDLAARARDAGYRDAYGDVAKMSVELRVVLLTVMAFAVGGEAAALVAVGSGHPTTFLFMCATVSAVLMAVMMAATFLRRFVVPPLDT